MPWMDTLAIGRARFGCWEASEEHRAGLLTTRWHKQGVGTMDKSMRYEGLVHQGERTRKDGITW